MKMIRILKSELKLSSRDAFARAAFLTIGAAAFSAVMALLAATACGGLILLWIAGNAIYLQNSMPPVALGMIIASVVMVAASAGVAVLAFRFARRWPK